MREESETLFRTLRAEKMSIAFGWDERDQDYNHELYNWRTPREYHPSLNAPAVQSNEYIADTDWESHGIQHSDNPRVFRPFPDTEPEEQIIGYEQSKTMSEFFLKAMCRENRGTRGRHLAEALAHPHSSPSRTNGFIGCRRATASNASRMSVRANGWARSSQMAASNPPRRI